jgi:riboflavin synthase
MFTGIVEESGLVHEVRESPAGIRLSVAARLTGTGSALGDSIAVNGCCLTLVDRDERGTLLSFDLLRETWERTNLSSCRTGSRVNLERAMRADGRLHGHFVTGHIDGTGTVEIFEQRGADWYLRITPPAGFLRYVVFKGAVAVDGISLTVAEVDALGFGVWIIPHTYAVTALSGRPAGSRVNLEADMLAKYVERLIATPRGD